MRGARAKGRVRVVLDTNVLVSALLWNGPESHLVRLVEAGRIDGYTSPAILAELYDVLTGEKFTFTDSEADLAQTYYALIFKTVAPAKVIARIAEDPADDSVLECAAEARAHYIVSGDRHLLDLRKFGRTKILRASQFLKLFQST